MFGRKKEKELATIEPTDVVTPTNSAAVMGMLQGAIDKGATPEALETLVNLQERILNREAEQAYNISMVAAQSAMPIIKPTSKNEQTDSMYAKLDKIGRAIDPIAAEHGFALSFGTAEPLQPGWVRVVCDVMHKAGHKERYWYDTPIDDEGIKGAKNKTQTHGIGSAASYGRRYLKTMVFDLTIGDDNDGNQPKAGNEAITEDQFKQLNKLADKVGADKALFCEFFKIDSMNELPMNQYNNAMRMLEEKKRG